VAVVGKEPIAGVAPSEVATLLGFVALALMLTGWAAERSRGSWRGTFGAVTVWAVLVAGLGGAYLHRGELMDAARTLSEDMGLGLASATVGQGGEVTVTRRIDGTFQVPARINDREVRFLFDTGASAVVLSAETAAAIGIPPESLKFRVPVSTANGRALAAPVTIDRLSIGPIEIRKVPALVAREGMLDGNLLGQTVLERLESYEVRGKRLVLRAAKS
jgi:aspartyl protease family protein